MEIITHVHSQVMHLGVSSTMATFRETLWISKLCEKVKEIINKRNVCKLHSAQNGKCQVLESKVTVHLK